ncbi:unnamed protein product [Chrysoparadoxa australica]
MSQMEGIDVYKVGSGPNAIIVVYDIFGMGMQVKQVCDVLADAGFNVAMPDFYEGAPWDPANFPPPDREAFMTWVKSGNRSFDETVKAKIEIVMMLMADNFGAKSFGVLGFCWGGYIAMRSAAELPIKAAGTAHPAFLDATLAEAVKVPFCSLPCPGDFPVEDLKAVLDKKPFGDQCVYKCFEDMQHGFCAGRGDYSDPLQKERASEAMGIFAVRLLYPYPTSLSSFSFLFF